MIKISDKAQVYLRKLIDQESPSVCGLRLCVTDPGTPRADVSLQFAKEQGGDIASAVIPYSGFSLYLAQEDQTWLVDASIDLATQGMGNQQLTIVAPGLKGHAPEAGAPLFDQVRWVIEESINPQLASHGGRVSVADVSSDGIVWLRFAGGCQGCSMADRTLKQGIEKNLMAKVPGITAVRDVTDHSAGEAPYLT